ncbi:putative protein of unknown function (DUF4042) [Trypanosoma vivax]|uniref:DUF4042 domain-containing protein n=1 Tax=Trypanosoma vivax (strain Y486) TaxID=1055687 RepID=G0U5C7_TRYVY|nr:hypothetical protein TRVL_01863 [Trypanosoma vivax]KAH8618396.1 putative protein of unknown function (DUF4042) [Trypanosoma vivax]CCC51075.1 conserved hypothetical protein [Trypanosoma vivax Y486]
MTFLLGDEMIGGVIQGALHTFYTSLCSVSEALLRAAGELTGLVDEVHQTVRHTSEATLLPQPVANVAQGMLLMPSHGCPVPSTLLVLATAAKFRALLHRTKSCGTATWKASSVVSELQDVEQAVLCSKLISWYCLATAWQRNMKTEPRACGGGGSPSVSHRHTRRPRNTPANVTLDGSQLEDESSELDAQLAEELFRVGVDAVARLSTYRQTSRVDGLMGAQCDSQFSKELCAEMRSSVLYLLVAALVRFGGSRFNLTLYLPVLFPVVDAKSARSMHPLLTPLLWDREVGVRTAAAVLSFVILKKTQPSLRYAEETDGTRKSFASLSAQGGRVLLGLHETLLWGLGLPSELEWTPRDAASHHSIGITSGLLLAVFSVLVSATPYQRCAHCVSLVDAALTIPVICEALRRKCDPEFKAVTAFLGEVFKSEHLTSVVERRLNLRRKCAERGADDGDHRGGLGSLLEALLAHAVNQMEVWRCVVQLARMHPLVVSAHFSLLIDASLTILRAIQNAGGYLTCADTSEEVTQLDATLSECLRAWLHFMGYLWQSFDGRSADPALRHDMASHRATLEQKQNIMTSLLIPTLLLTSDDFPYTETHRAALRCVAQVGDETLQMLSPTVRGKIRAQVIAGTASRHDDVRAEAITTVGVWSWKYVTFDSELPDFVNRSVSALRNDPCARVRFKAAFALSNITSRLCETEEDHLTEFSETKRLGDDKTATSEGIVNNVLLRQSPQHVQLLCDIAVYATLPHQEAAIASHGIRMMSHLLRCLTFEELIAELTVDGLEQPQGVAEGFFDTLLRFMLPSSRDAKLRWNAACALGFALAREVVFDAEPKGATKAVERLCVLLCHDCIFKVRTQAATALGRISPTFLVAGRYAASDLTLTVTRALCSALQQVVGDETENFAQYKEQGALRVALKRALEVMITGAAPSGKVQSVFAEYRRLLVEEGLL